MNEPTVNLPGRAGTKRTAEHPSEEWERQRPIFEDLYSHKRLKLSEVRDIMAKEHGFEASEAQYKKRLKAWGLNKNIKAKEKDAMLRKRQDRLEENGVASRFKLRGNDVADHKLERYKRSCKHTEMAPPPEHPRTPAGLLCFTPNMDAVDGMSRNPQAAVHPTSLESRPQLSTTSPSRSIERRERATFPSFTSNPDVSSHPSAETDTRFSRYSDLMAMYVYSIWFLPWEKVTYSHSNTAELTKAPPNLSVMHIASFTRYLRTVFETMRIPPNLVYLAILYIYRLKKINPAVIGKPGSEYRVAVMALLLADRYLDDFHYTPRTWSEVSGLPSHDMSIMEIEFMSNMRYSLFVSQDDWCHWSQELQAHLSNLSTGSSSEAFDNQDVISSSSTQDGLVPANQETQDTMRLIDTPISNLVPILTQTPALGARAPTPVSARRIAAPPPMVNSPLSPSGFFSPVIHSWWPSFLDQRSTLEPTGLISDQAELHANDIPQEKLQWVDVAGRDDQIHQGHLPLTDEYFDALDPSIVW